MKLAGMNITYRYYPFTYFLDSMQRLGLDTIELWVGEPHLFVYRNLLSNLQTIRKEVSNRNIEIACITPEQCVYPYNLASSDIDWRRKSFDYFKENIYVTAELNSKMMLITSGIGDFSVQNKESWNYALDSITKLTTVAEEEGIDLVLEPLTTFETNLITNGYQVKQMIKETKSPVLNAMIDTVSMHLAGETPEDFFELFGQDMIHFHLVDGNGHTDGHLSLGDGVLPIHDYLNSLRKHNYNGICTLEVMGSQYYRNPEKALRRSIDFIDNSYLHTGIGGEQ